MDLKLNSDKKDQIQWKLDECLLCSIVHECDSFSSSIEKWLLQYLSQCWVPTRTISFASLRAVGEHSIQIKIAVVVQLKAFCWLLLLLQQYLSITISYNHRNVNYEFIVIIFDVGIDYFLLNIQCWSGFDKVRRRKQVCVRVPFRCIWHKNNKTNAIRPIHYTKLFWSQNVLIWMNWAIDMVPLFSFQSHTHHQPEQQPSNDMMRQSIKMAVKHIYFQLEKLINEEYQLKNNLMIAAWKCDAANWQSNSPKQMRNNFRGKIEFWFFFFSQKT